MVSVEDEGGDALGARCVEVRAVATAITARSGRVVSFVDERYSTARTHRALHEAGGKVGDHRHDLDAMTAAMLLQGVLDGGAVMVADAAADAE